MGLLAIICHGHEGIRFSLLNNIFVPLSANHYPLASVIDDCSLNASYLDINDVSHSVSGQVGGQVLDTLALVGPREHVSGTAPVTLSIGHLVCWRWSGLSNRESGKGGHNTGCKNT